MKHSVEKVEMKYPIDWVKSEVNTGRLFYRAQALIGKVIKDLIRETETLEAWNNDHVKHIEHQDNELERLRKQNGIYEKCLEIIANHHKCPMCVSHEIAKEVLAEAEKVGEE